MSLLALMLAGCNGDGEKGESFSEALASGRFLGTTSGSNSRAASASSIAGATQRTPSAVVDLGTDQGAAASFQNSGAPIALQNDGGSFSLNFVNVDVQEFVRSVFEEVLKANVVVDPGVSGRVTVRTANPVSRSEAIGLIRNVLSMNGASLSEAGGTFRVLASSGEGGQGQSASSFRVVSLNNIDAEQARAALQPFGADPSKVVSLSGGKVVLLTGAEGDLDRFVQVLSSLDIDQFKGKSFVLQPLETAGAQAVSSELNQMFGGNRGSFQAYPVERMNAVLLMGTSKSLIQRARTWLTRLDQGGSEQKGVHVYPVQNRDASEIAGVLQSMVAAKSTAASQAQATQGVEPAVASAPAQSGGDGGIDPTTQFGGTGEPAAGAAQPVGGASQMNGISISADKSTNSLVIVASDEDYALIEKAIRRLDVMPPQVLIEATIAEVSLNDSLKHGVRWFFQSGNNAALLSDGSGSTINPIVPGFNYIFSVTDARLVINALEGVTNVQVISSPALTVLDNQTATLKVGDQVPIATRSAQSVTDPEAPIVSEIQMKDTGIILNVKPRVNASGLVQLDISQEISDVVATTTSSIDSPTIQQRAITSSVVVQSGTEIILGGLISAKKERSRTGVPLLKDIPLLGEAFTTNRVKTSDKTELMIIIKPVVLRTNVDVNAVTSEIKARLFAN
ncbi:type II secretion system secretin GspD [Oryzibacter oryziterrae]|uniref:type II secretion system secretin GspD n=1 Tax=Oryzibacter oryziterrae TaxID=2766474 RepID=UPI001F0253C1|nr:type II secretion system secretin GspD [Oryzibacter oryziterrae]